MPSSKRSLEDDEKELKEEPERKIAKSSGKQKKQKKVRIHEDGYESLSQKADFVIVMR